MVGDGWLQKKTAKRQNSVQMWQSKKGEAKKRIVAGIEIMEWNDNAKEKCQWDGDEWLY